MLTLLVLAACGPVSVGEWNDGEPGDGGAADGGTADGGSIETGLPVDDVAIGVHRRVATMLVVTWMQEEPTDGAWLEFRTEGGEWQSSPVVARPSGEASDLVIGVPADAEVEIRLGNLVDGESQLSSHTWTARTDRLPSDLPVPSLVEYHPEIASGERYILGTVDTNRSDWYGGPFYIWIMDRDGQIVWYRAIDGTRACMMPRVARDGTHILFEESTTYTWGDFEDPVLHRATLDGETDIELAVPGFIYAFDETDDGRIVSDYSNAGGYGLAWRGADGSIDRIWTCTEGGTYICYTNTVNLSPAQDTVLWSLPTANKVLEISVATGSEIRRFGGVDLGTWQTDSADTRFEFQHYPNFTPEGTLLLSTHVPGTTNQQRAREYRLDESTKTLEQVWEYGEGVDEYAYYSGEAWRLPNGNTFINYGTGGAAREVTADGEVAWDVAWPSKLLTGHMTLIDDLYAINAGPGR